VRAWLRMLFVVMLACQASEVLAFAAPEPCALATQDDRPDQQCPPTCARCACCAQAIVIAPAFLLVHSIIPLYAEPALDLLVPSVAPADVLHVPKALDLDLALL
jgi:hypothetical protein